MSPVRISDEAGQSDELQPVHQPRLWVQLHGRRRSEERRARPPEFRSLASSIPSWPPPPAPPLGKGGPGGVGSGGSAAGSDLLRNDRAPRLPGIAGQVVPGSDRVEESA